MKVSLHIKTTIYAGKDANGSGIYHDIDASAEAESSEYSLEECVEEEVARSVNHALFHAVGSLMAEQDIALLEIAMRSIGYAKPDDDEIDS